jgi:hypothetical protein
MSLMGYDLQPKTEQHFAPLEYYVIQSRILDSCKLIFGQSLSHRSCRPGPAKIHPLNVRERASTGQAKSILIKHSDAPLVAPLVGRSRLALENPLSFARLAAHACTSVVPG